MKLKLGPQVPRLATEFPHVLNRLAEIWERPQDTDAFFTELMLPDRSGRQGFGLEVIQELLALRDRHRRRLLPPPLPHGRLETDWCG